MRLYLDALSERQKGKQMRSYTHGYTPVLQLSMQLAAFAAEAPCRLLLNLLSIRTPMSFPAKLLSSKS